jgi:hypothetical protein
MFPQAMLAAGAFTVLFKNTMAGDMNGIDLDSMSAMWRYQSM